MHLLFLSWELAPLARDYQVMMQSQANPQDFMNAMIQFGRKYNMEFAGSSDFVNYLQLNPDNPVTATKILELINLYYNNSLNTATLGASGAVFGILAAFVYLFPNTYIYLYFLVPVKAKWLGLLYFSYELFFALKNSAGDHVARWAHIGGAIVGLLIVITWNKTNKKTFY
jgi:hypothetical protein